MIARLKLLKDKIMTSVVSGVKKALTLLTLFSFPVLFVFFFIYLYRGLPIYSLVCLAGIYTFIHLNKVL